MNDKSVETIWKALDNFHIELPSWGFANTGTRFGKFIQAAAATTIEEKFSDACQIHALTGTCPTLALHVQWDLPKGLQDVPEVENLAQRFGIRPGSINPNIFEDQQYKYGSIGNPDPAIRQMAIQHILDCVVISQALKSRDVSAWFADGSNYPGTQNIRKRIGYFEEGLREIHATLKPRQRLLIEYKPFEPAFYHTDIADWGMALLLAKHSGPQASVLVDTGHHYQAQNIEQIVPWLLQQKCSLVDAEETLRGAFWQDVRPAIRQWRKTRGLPEDPLDAFRASGYLQRITAERKEKNRSTAASYA